MTRVQYRKVFGQRDREVEMGPDWIRLFLT